jgi:hypothetical protein
MIAETCRNGREYMKKNILFGFTAVLAVACLACLGLPIISVYSVGEFEAGEIMIRGYNLAEFSFLGCLALLYPLISLGIILGKISDGGKHVLLLCNLVLTAIE